MNFRVVLLLGLLKYSAAQDANCDFYQDVSSGDTRYINSPNYPNNYPPGVTCRWIAKCPAGYNCRIDCTIRMPQSQGCTMDRLMVSKTGDPQLNSAETYCGTESLTAVSNAQSIALGLMTNSSGGRFECSLVAQPVNTTISCSCGVRRQNRIVGGVETGTNEFPMLAGLVKLKPGRIICATVIISYKFVLSAARCVANQPVDNYAVIVGEHDVSTGSDTNTAAVHAIEAFIIHPLFTIANSGYDIAIVRVAGNITFNESVGPVCLPFSQRNNDFAGSKVTVVVFRYRVTVDEGSRRLADRITVEQLQLLTVTYRSSASSLEAAVAEHQVNICLEKSVQGCLEPGWGTTSPGGPTSNVPLKVDLEVLSQSTCKSRGALVTDRQMCTYTPGKGSCEDDSGGLLLWTNPINGLLYIAGIVGYGGFCASPTPGTITRVTSFLDWIVLNAPDDYCRK